MSQPTEAEARVGTVLGGRFQITRVLGESLPYVTYEIVPLQGEGRWVAVVARRAFVVDEAASQRVVSSLATATALSHPNIARVFEAGYTDDGLPFYVREGFEGVPLSAYVRLGGAMPVAQAAPIVHGILQGLAEAHRAGHVHRDLRPENVFLSRDLDGRFVPKLLGFGAAKLMDEVGGMVARVQPGGLVGSAIYLGPEQIIDGKRADPRSDIWACAAMLFIMLTGADPFPAPNEVARLSAAVIRDAILPETVAPALASWNEFFRRGLARGIESRFATAEQMDEALLTVARGGEIATRPNEPATASTPGKSARRTTTAEVEAVPAMVAASAPPSVKIVQAADGLDATLREGESPPASRAASGVPVWTVFVASAVALAIGFALGFLAARS